MQFANDSNNLHNHQRCLRPDGDHIDRCKCEELAGLVADQVFNAGQKNHKVNEHFHRRLGLVHRESCNQLLSGKLVKHVLLVEPVQIQNSCNWNGGQKNRQNVLQGLLLRSMLGMVRVRIQANGGLCDLDLFEFFDVGHGAQNKQVEDKSVSFNIWRIAKYSPLQ
ncbi:hypothetical protein OGAPHI_004135 [Ogataea philodendri]|uniref:Uncharacterized protein n=1 Tax=Ogataea philodendri TaxID=1378263 RepID=A0A9P8T5H8_9ASCO|nr:uncharacterized protein OGAPHI_004135 [Ogataea philodendri]KAH3665946.1 hypothetical protein OGAPHI_004135 [Ogataea philodendri]